MVHSNGAQVIKFHRRIAFRKTEAVIDLTSVKELLGHKSLTMTLRYSHLAPGHKRKAVYVLDRLMEENKNGVLRNGYVLGTIPKDDTRLDCPKSLKNNVRPEGIEPSTH